MDKHKGHRGQKKKEKWRQQHPGLTRTQFAKEKRLKRLKRREEKIKGRQNKLNK